MMLLRVGGWMHGCWVGEGEPCLRTTPAILRRCCSPPTALSRPPPARRATWWTLRAGCTPATSACGCRAGGSRSLTGGGRGWGWGCGVGEGGCRGRGLGGQEAGGQAECGQDRITPPPKPHSSPQHGKHPNPTLPNSRPHLQQQKTTQAASPTLNRPQRFLPPSAAPPPAPPARRTSSSWRRASTWRQRRLRTSTRARPLCCR